MEDPVTDPAIVFCTTCKGRTQHVEMTLPRNLEDNADYPNCKFLILDYNSQDHLLPYLKANHQDAIDAGRLIIYSFPDPGPFRMAHAKNMAHRLGMMEGADILCNLDADNYTGREQVSFAQYIANSFRYYAEQKKDIFMWARMVHRGDDRLPRGISGRIAVSVKAFLASGGYDERFNDWSPDDKDFNFRLRRLGYTAFEIAPGFLKAVLHNDRMRFREYPQARTPLGEDQIETYHVNDSDTTIANYGRIGRGVVYRLGDPKPIRLNPLPTRIFGIGMHKTATCSLHTALKILGYDSAHWKNAHWAKAIWDEMNTWGRSLTLEQYYALSDLPITLLYQELDRGYPGSKFILTTRDENRWIKSVQNHWSREHNKFREQWSTDPFTHKIHKELYGQKGFDATVFLARYRRHNAEVAEYFRDRPDDLLMLDMNNNPGWNELCRFLQCPVPSVPYPKEYVTE